MPLRVNPHGFFFSSTPTSPHLLLFSPSIPLFLPSLMRAKPRFARFLLFGQRLALQQPRCASRGLLVQDTTDIDLSHRRKISGVGQIGNERGRGFFVQTVLAVRPETREV